MESNSSSPTHRPAPGTPSNKLPEQEFCGKCPDNLLSLEITKQKRISITEKENHELHQELEQLLLANPTLETDLNSEEKRFYYKALNHHLTDEQIKSTSSEEMLIFLGNKIKASKTTQISSDNSPYDEPVEQRSDQIIAQKKEQKTVTILENKASQALKPQHTTKYQSSAPKKTPISTTTKGTKQPNLPKREIRAPEKPQPKHESQQIQPLFLKKTIEDPLIPQRNESQAIENSPAPQIKEIPSGTSKHNF